MLLSTLHHAAQEDTQMATPAPAPTPIPAAVKPTKKERGPRKALTKASAMKRILAVLEALAKDSPGAEKAVAEAVAKFYSA